MKGVCDLGAEASDWGLGQSEEVGEMGLSEEVGAMGLRGEQGLMLMGRGRG